MPSTATRCAAKLSANGAPSQLARPRLTTTNRAQAGVQELCGGLEAGLCRRLPAAIPGVDQCPDLRNTAGAGHRGGGPHRGPGRAGPGGFHERAAAPPATINHHRPAAGESPACGEQERTLPHVRLTDPSRLHSFGSGRIGQVHARNIAAHPDLELAWIADPFIKGARALAADHRGAGSRNRR